MGLAELLEMSGNSKQPRESGFSDKKQVEVLVECFKSYNTKHDLRPGMIVRGKYRLGNFHGADRPHVFMGMIGDRTNMAPLEPLNIGNNHVAEAKDAIIGDFNGEDLECYLVPLARIEPHPDFADYNATV